TKLEDAISEVFFHSFLRTDLWFSKPGLRQFHSVVRVVVHLLKHVLPLLTFKAGSAYRNPIPSLVHCWWRCCRVGGECIVGFLACTSICVSQSFFPLFRLAFSNANGYKFKRVHQELATLEMLRENFGIQ
ncbi:unnamed protein product, partial [Brassica oleracea]